MGIKDKDAENKKTPLGLEEYAALLLAVHAGDTKDIGQAIITISYIAEHGDWNAQNNEGDKQ